MSAPLSLPLKCVRLVSPSCLVHRQPCAFFSSWIDSLTCTSLTPSSSHYLLKCNHSWHKSWSPISSGSLLWTLHQPSLIPLSLDAFISTLALSSPICLLTPSTHGSGILILPSWVDGKSPRANVVICWFWEQKCWSSLVQFSPTRAGGWQMEDPPTESLTIPKEQVPEDQHRV